MLCSLISCYLRKCLLRLGSCTSEFLLMLYSPLPYFFTWKLLIIYLSVVYIVVCISIVHSLSCLFPNSALTLNLSGWTLRSLVLVIHIWQFSKGVKNKRTPVKYCKVVSGVCVVSLCMFQQQTMQLMLLRHHTGICRTDWYLYLLWTWPVFFFFFFY